MQHVEPLERYFPFDADILESVNGAADWLNTFSYQELADKFGVGDGPERTEAPDGKTVIETLTFTPTGEYDEKSARSLRLPMGHGINRNMTARAMLLFAADQTEQLIITGNPSLPGNSAGTIPFGRAVKAMREKSLALFVEPSLWAFKQRGLEQTDELGFSLAADLAATASAESARFDIAVRHGVYVDSAAWLKRHIGRLGLDFHSTMKHLPEYRAEGDSVLYNEAVSHEKVWWVAKYVAGLGRMSNLAIEMTLADGGFHGRVRSALAMQPNMHAAVGWCENGELGNDELNGWGVRLLQAEFGAERAVPFRFSEAHHSVADNIRFHAAMMMQGLRA